MVCRDPFHQSLNNHVLHADHQAAAPFLAARPLVDIARDAAPAAQVEVAYAEIRAVRYRERISKRRRDVSEI